MTILARLIFAFCTATSLVAPVRAQTTAPVVSASLPSRSTTRTTTHTVTATIAGINAVARTVSLRLLSSAQQTEPVVTAIPDAMCRPLKNNRPAAITDFAIGEPVVARLTWRTIPERVIVLRELYDSVSFAERERQSKDMCVGTVLAFTATEISVRRNDGFVIAFRVTEKTRLVKQDQPALVTAFPAGTPVAVKPRRLPSGELQAAIVGSTAQDVDWAYHDTLSSWSGSIVRVQGEERSGAIVSLRRDDGAPRRFLFPVGARFQQGRSLLPWRLLLGASVSVHLVKGAERDGMRYADTVKVAARRTAKPSRDTIEEP